MNSALAVVLGILAAGIGTLALLGGVVIVAVVRNLLLLRKARREQK
jgi:hypothetical protein